MGCLNVIGLGPISASRPPPKDKGQDAPPGPSPHPRTTLRNPTPWQHTYTSHTSFTAIPHSPHAHSHPTPWSHSYTSHTSFTIATCRDRSWQRTTNGNSQDHNQDKLKYRYSLEPPISAFMGFGDAYICAHTAKDQQRRLTWCDRSVCGCLFLIPTQHRGVVWAVCCLHFARSPVKLELHVNGCPSSLEPLNSVEIHERLDSTLRVCSSWIHNVPWIIDQLKPTSKSTR